MHQVKYWALGNETWGPWQVEQMTKEAYAHKALQWAKGEPLPQSMNSTNPSTRISVNAQH